MLSTEGVGGTQDDGDFSEQSSDDGHVARLVGDAVILFEGWVVLFVHDDQAEAGEGKEQR